MSRIVINTDVWSFLFKGDTRSALYNDHIKGMTPCIAFASIGELYLWAELRNWGASRKSELSRVLQQHIVLPWDDAVSQQWARIRAERQRLGKPIAAQDAWIAACAVRHDLPPVTHNIAHFEGITDLIVVTARS